MKKIYHLVITVTEENPDYSPAAETEYQRKVQYGGNQQFMEMPPDANKTRTRDALRADVTHREFEVLKRAIIEEIDRELDRGPEPGV